MKNKIYNHVFYFSARAFSLFEESRQVQTDLRFLLFKLHWSIALLTALRFRTTETFLRTKFAC